MGDHFVLKVDRLLTESTLNAASGPSANDEKMINCSSHLNSETNLSPSKLVECRICQDEEEDSRMETPCSCCGSLKYAHRRCVQRWCNEKGNTVCEICHQQFNPGYSAPPPLIHLVGISTNLRGNWEIGRRDLLNIPRIITMISTDHNFLHADYDESTNSISVNLMFCCSVVIILMGLLVLRHMLPALLSGTENNAFPLFMLLILRYLGFILLVYIILAAVSARQRRRRQQAADVSFSLSDEEADMATTLHQSHIIHAH